MLRALLALLGFSLAAAFVAFAPNLIWLARSTARVTNDSARVLHSFRLKLGERQVIVGPVAPGQSRFVFLPETGDATLQAIYSVDSHRRTGCQEYIEGSMFHVNVSVGADLEARCEATTPLTERLFWDASLGLRSDPHALSGGAP